MLNSTIFLLTITISSLFIGCSSPIPEPVKIHITNQEIDYLNDVKPILDKRCVSCHSCYNSPCQAKLSSFEGVDRGGSKLLVYDALRFKSMDPTRLFIDAQSTDEWHKKGFYSLTKNLDANESRNDSIMMHMLHDKKMNPEVIGSYRPESDELICPKNTQEMGDYLDDKPNHGMPYGLPQIKDSEYNTLTQWLAKGAHGPTPTQQKAITSPSKKAEVEIRKWESFLNKQDAKHSVTARYLYEHLYLAHWYFKAAPNEFYEIVRSKTPYPQEIDIIPSVRPFDDPGVKNFYYRLQRIHSTIVHKTHMVVEFDDEKLARIKELFIEPRWMGEPHYMDYDTKNSANPFVTFFQIPVKSRYQFLLDNSHYIVMTFIRGPVCRGQMALNVIHDHFWVMFEDPDSDVSVKNPGFLLLQADNLSMPIETSTQAILETFSDDYLKKYKDYYLAKEKLQIKTYPNGRGIESIWKGESPEDSPMLTIYRHFDSASVHHGVLGGLPRTLWVIDYPQLERIYYSLVAGYDVFGNISHQTNVRRYMDFLRYEGELNFLTYLPKESRYETLTSWYKNSELMNVGEEKKNHFLERDTKVKYKTIYPKGEFAEQIVNNHILKSTNIKFDDINYRSEGIKAPKMPKKFTNHEDIRNGFKALTSPGTGFITHMTDSDINNILIRIIMPDGNDITGSIIINRWHDNVNSMFSEEDTLDSSRDTLDFTPFFVGSYPNSFTVLHYRDLPDFFDILQNFDGSDEYIYRLHKYHVGRSDEKFWETFDWFQNNFNKTQPIESGLYDLNRYYHK